MYCHLRPPDAMPLLTLNTLGTPGHQRPNFDGCICIHYAAPPYSVRIGSIYTSHLAKFAWASFADLSARRLATNRTQTLRRVARNSGPILVVCGPTFTKFWDYVEEPLYFSVSLSDCLLHVSFRRYSLLSLDVVEKPNKCKSFLAPNFLGGMTPTFVRQIFSAIYPPPFGKVWLSSVCWSPSAKPGDEVESRIYRGSLSAGENGCPILSRLWTKVHDIWRRCRKALAVSNALARLCILYFIPKIYAVKVPLSCEVVENRWFGPPNCRGRVYPRFWTYIFKSHSVPSMWPVLAEFRSASSEGS